MDMIPFMEVDSVLTKKRGVSLPFTDYCKPILSNKSTLEVFVSYLRSYGEKAGWKSFELRGEEGFPSDWPILSQYYLHTLDLNRSEESLFSSLRSSTRRNIKKAIKSGVTISRSNSLHAMKAFYRLNCMTRKRHGLPPQPYSFFKQIAKHVLAEDRGSILLACYRSKIIAGAVYFHFGEKVIYKYGASDTSFQNLRANNLVMWEAIKHYNTQTYQTFCFGRTSPKNKGLLQFKTGWGTKESILNYYKFDLHKNAFQKDNFEIGDRLQNIFKQTPLPLLKMISFFSYRHIA